MTRSSLEVTGVSDLLQKLSGLQGDELAKQSQRTIARVSARVLAPAMADLAPENRGKQPQDGHQRGLLRNRRKYTARKVRTRGREALAYSVKPRVWYAHMVIKGTKPHVIRSKTGRLFLGWFAAEVHHPGSRGNDYIRRAAQGKDELLANELGRDLMRRFSK